ncbi:hypothetical protein ES707_09181 [subsurface metagenome]
MGRARITSPGRATSGVGGRSASARMQARGFWCASTSAATLPGRSTLGLETRSAPPKQRRCARKSRHVDSVTHDGAVSTRSGYQGSRCRKPMPSKRWRATPIMQTARSAMWRSRTTTRRSGKARCSRPGSPAAIATSRTAPSSVSPAKASACNVMRPTNMPMRNIATTPGPTRHRPASHATCQPGPTW